MGKKPPAVHGPGTKVMLAHPFWGYQIYAHDGAELAFYRSGTWALKRIRREGWVLDNHPENPPPNLANLVPFNQED